MTTTCRSTINRLFAGGISDEATPVPIPNTEVKLICAHGTARVTRWESRTSPAFILNRTLIYFEVRFFIYMDIVGTRTGGFILGKYAQYNYWNNHYEKIDRPNYQPK